MPTETDIAWLAGLLEGEGYFRAYQEKKRRPKLQVQLLMTDRDIVERAAGMFSASSRAAVAKYSKPPPDKDTYRFYWCGVSAEQLMQAILPYMGNRRGAKIRECLSTPNLSHTPREKAAA